MARSRLTTLARTVQLGRDDQQPLLVRLGRNDLEQRDDLTGIRQAVTDNSELGELAQLFDSDAGVSQRLNDCPRPKRLVLEVTPENLQPQIDFYVGGALRAIGDVVPDMVAAGTGTILVTTGGGSISPMPFLGNVNIAATGLRNWVLNLHNALESKGVYVAHVGITALIGAGHPEAEPDVIAKAYTALYDERQDAELHYVAYDA